MNATSVIELIEKLRSADSAEARSAQAAALKLAVEDMQRSIDSLEGQLKDFYDAQVDHSGRNLDDYKRMVASLDEQVRCYIDDRA